MIGLFLLSKLNNLLSLVNNHIIIDSLDTWPNQLINLLKQNQEVLTSYLNFEKDIDNRAIEEIDLRINRPKNEYKKKWDSIIDSINKIMKSKKFVGFHCTRLINKELNIIKKDGLNPLNLSCLMERLKYLYNQNKISKDTFEFLKTNNLASEKNRQGKIYFFHCLDTLLSCSGIENLLKFWGGEAIYRCCEDNYKTKNELLNTGIPCIVLGSLNYNQLNAFNPEIEIRLIKIFLNKSNMQFNYNDFDNFAENSVSVIDIITYNDDLFDYLTGSNFKF